MIETSLIGGENVIFDVCYMYNFGWFIDKFPYR